MRRNRKKVALSCGKIVSCTGPGKSAVQKNSEEDSLSPIHLRGEGGIARKWEGERREDL